MSKALGPLLARAAIDETETQHDAVGRLVQLLLFEKKSGPKSSAEDAAIIDARNALFGLLESSRPGVVSKACHGRLILSQCDGLTMHVPARCAMCHGVAHIPPQKCCGGDASYSTHVKRFDHAAVDIPFHVRRPQAIELQTILTCYTGRQ